MSLRVSCVSAAVLALLTLASACFAADSLTVIQRGKASLGGQLGLSRFLSDEDYTKSRDAGGAFGSSDVRQRFAFAANFRYTMSPSWRWQIAPGYTWTGYQKDSPVPFPDPNYPGDTTKEKYLTQAMPVSAQIHYVHRLGKWYWHFGGGPNVTRVWIENRRKVLKDPVSKKLHKGFYPGASFEVGAERYLKSLPSVTLEFAASGHYVMAQRDEQFPSGFNSALSWAELRFGANYYFDPVKRFAKKDKSAGPAKK